MARRHQRILGGVYFSGGARAEEIGRLLTEAGFDRPVVDWKMGAIHRAQARHMTWSKALERATEHRFAICATKPERAAAGLVNRLMRTEAFDFAPLTDQLEFRLR